MGGNSVVPAGRGVKQWVVVTGWQEVWATSVHLVLGLVWQTVLSTMRQACLDFFLHTLLVMFLPSPRPGRQTAEVRGSHLVTEDGMHSWEDCSLQDVMVLFSQ